MVFPFTVGIAVVVSVAADTADIAAIAGVAVCALWTVSAS